MIAACLDIRWLELQAFYRICDKNRHIYLMKHPFLHRRSFFPSIMLLMLLTTGVARAEYIAFTSETQTTLLWCAVILAAGRIIAAYITSRPR